MGINPVSNTQSAYNTDVSGREKNHRDFTESAQENSIPASTEVSISHEGLSKVREQKVYPLEYYQAPYWSSDMYTPMRTLELGISPTEYKKTFEKINTLSSSDRAYYHEARQKHWVELLKENDLWDNPEKYYQEMIVNKESSEQYRLKWEEKLSSDTKLMSLYEKGKYL